MEKDLLIESVAPHVNNGLILFHPAHTVLNTQVSHWPEADHDDGPDAVQMLWRLCLKRAGGMLPRHAPTPLALLAPELTYYVTGLSKCLGAGLRTAYVCAPNARKAQTLAGALRATTVMASPITNALATRWVTDGTADAMLHAVRAESMARQSLASHHLGQHQFLAQAEGFHLWLPLSSAWSTVEFASYLRTQGRGRGGQHGVLHRWRSTGCGAHLPGWTVVAR